MRLLLSTTYEIVTEESAAVGDAQERGFEIQEAPTEVRDVVRELARCSGISVWPVRGPRDLTGWEWASTESDQSTADGSWRSESVHVRRLDRSPLSPRALFRLFRAAGLCAGRLS